MTGLRSSAFRLPPTVMSNRSKFRLPREHGAWAMLYVPFAVGALAAGSISIRLVFLFLSVTFVFIARESLLGWWRSRSRGQKDDQALKYLAIYLLLAGAFGMPLLALWQLFWFAPVAIGTLMLLAFNARQAIQREDRTTASEIIAIAGLTLTAPASHYVARGHLDLTALWLWVLCSMYFASSVFYVKLRVSTLNPRKETERRESWRLCALYHGFLLASLLLMAFGGSLSLLVLVAFAPVLIRSLFYLARPVRRINLKLIGWLEVGYSVVFLVFMTLTFRVGF